TQYGPKLQIGVLSTADEKSEEEGAAVPFLFTGENEPFGDLAPFCEPSWYQDFYSPYYDESHRKLRAHMRKWLSENTYLEHLDEWNSLIQQSKPPPRWVFEKLGEAGIFRLIVGPPWTAPNAPGVPSLPMGIKDSDWNMFHELVALDEIAQSPSILFPLTGGQAFAIPPLTKYGNEWMKNKLVPDLYAGRKTIALAISEPHAGSDVQNIQTTAVLSEDKKYYIVNGEKKWITGGVWADYFTTAVRTGAPGSGARGITMLLIPRMAGVKTRHIETQGGSLGGTAYVTFEDVKVPVENVIGKVDRGFKVIMTNFNHERFLICIQAIRSARVCYQEAFHYAHKRKTFGVHLISHAVIRDKLAQMSRQIEATQCWIEHLCYQLTKMPQPLQDARLGGAFALCKLQCTRTFEFCAREASQIMGGIAYTKG
ncbi:hypothetical protein HK102_010027, partial [Quaeritorhiza haematococci]